MTQDALHEFLVRAQFIQIRRNATSESVPAIPFQPNRLHGWTNDALSQLVQVPRPPPPEWNIKPLAGFPVETRYAFRDSASWRMTGTAWALARVFGRLTTVFRIDRLTVERIAGIGRPLEPSEFAFAEPSKGRGTSRTGADLGLGRNGLMH